MPAAQLSLDISAIFNKAQEGTGGHSKYAKMLWSHQNRDSDKCWEELCTTSHYLMSIPPVHFLP